MRRTIIGAACLIIGLLLLAPGSLRLWLFGKSYWAAYDVRPLPEPQAAIIMHVAGRPIDDAILLIMAVVGFVALVGMRILR